jgi:uncharacterized protein
MDRSMDEPLVIDLTRLANELGFRVEQLENVVALLDAGNTIPFITRYRKEKTGNLDEVQLRTIEQRVRSLRQLKERARTIQRLIDAQGKLTPELRAALDAAETLKLLEDLYLPFRPKRTSRASLARERGLEPLASRIWSGAADSLDLNAAAADFLNPEKELPTTAEVLQGAADILAENISEDASVRDLCRKLAWQTGKLSGMPTKAGTHESHEYRDYFEFTESVRKIPPHRVLAINRGEKSGALRIKFVWDDAAVQAACLKFYRWDAHPHREFLTTCLTDAIERLIQPSLEREVRRELTEEAESQAITVFARNLRSLLLQPPLRGVRVTAIDPGFRTGCKVAVLDECGRLLESDVIYVTGNAEKRAASIRRLAELLRQHQCEVVVIGNGTACRETEDLVSQMISTELPQVRYVIVNEAGASIYSTSQIAREEFPDLDATGRSTISIGRRLLDPLSELVKIDPQHIGVGMYQHDVSKKKLKESLDQVVESCVNFVGVDLNTASASLLRHVSGLNQLIARRVVEWREQHGRFTNRRQLQEVSGLGDAAFTQAAGFLRIVGGDEPLDGTWIHPESYDTANKLLARFGLNAQELMQSEQARAELRQRLDEDAAVMKLLAEELNVGLPTLQDIVEALFRPGRDPRSDLPGPIFKQGILNLDDLQEGMELRGTVCNVVDFGAFVDVGLKDSGLVHISQMSVNYIPSPHSLVSVGDVVTVYVLGVDKERKRVSLSMIRPGTPRQVRGPKPPQEKRSRRAESIRVRADERRPETRSPEIHSQVQAPPVSPAVTMPPAASSDTTQSPDQPKVANADRETPLQAAQNSKTSPPRTKHNSPPVRLTPQMVDGKEPLQGFDQLAALWKQNHSRRQA